MVESSSVKLIRKSPWLFHFNSGGCNGCDIEVVASLTPKYDIERLGAMLTSSPKHADILVVTGPVTRQTAGSLKMIYDQIPEPKLVLAVGTCACSGGVFRGGYNVLGGVDKVIKNPVCIPGCPPNPRLIYSALKKLYENKLGGGSKDGSSEPEQK
ncbi:MAG: NADH-quinone oxidoreductase subunit B family protein [Fervidicoccaceae archaeon]|jgi:Ni,Fe-hydrogenase III small subunit